MINWWKDAVEQEGKFTVWVLADPRVLSGQPLTPALFLRSIYFLTGPEAKPVAKLSRFLDEVDQFRDENGINSQYYLPAHKTTLSIWGAKQAVYITPLVKGVTRQMASAAIFATSRAVGFQQMPGNRSVSGNDLLLRRLPQFSCLGTMTLGWYLMRSAFEGVEQYGWIEVARGEVAEDEKAAKRRLMARERDGTGSAGTKRMCLTLPDDEVPASSRARANKAHCLANQPGSSH